RDRRLGALRRQPLSVRRQRSRHGLLHRGECLHVRRLRPAELFADHGKHAAYVAGAQSDQPRVRGVVRPGLPGSGLSGCAAQFRRRSFVQMVKVSVESKVAEESVMMPWRRRMGVDMWIKVLLSCVALLGLTGIARAADAALPTRPLAPLYVPSWTGCYV